MQSLKEKQKPPFKLRSSKSNQDHQSPKTETKKKKTQKSENPTNCGRKPIKMLRRKKNEAGLSFRKDCKKMKRRRKRLLRRTGFGFTHDLSPLDHNYHTVGKQQKKQHSKELPELHKDNPEILILTINPPSALLLFIIFSLILSFILIYSHNSLI
jgi:hypothetical protein